MSQTITNSNLDTNLKQCIYCTSAIDFTRGEGDHVIPASLGSFKGDIRFHRICNSCNNHIGRSEQYLPQSGIAAVLGDDISLINSRRKKHSIRSLCSGLGVNSPQFAIDHEDHHELIKLDEVDPSKDSYIDQIVILDEHDVEHSVRLYPGMSAKDVKKKIQLLGIDPQKVWYHCDQSRYDEFMEIALSVLPGGTLQELPSTERGVQTVILRIKTTLTNHYFRAIAKIAFHYYLTRNRRGLRGDETQFKPLRNFIINGGNREQFFHASGRKFVMPFRNLNSGGCITPSEYCHVLVADEREEVIVVYVQLFVGPGAIPLPHYVTLGPTESKLVFSDLIWGHEYKYKSNMKPEKYSGVVEKLALTRTNPWTY